MWLKVSGGREIFQEELKDKYLKMQLVSRTTRDQFPRQFEIGETT